MFGWVGKLSIVFTIDKVQQILNNSNSGQIVDQQSANVFSNLPTSTNHFGGWMGSGY
ncbi:TPA: hypothetical protein QCY71_005592 [Bacillus cereus]|nr:hypothetical protein [Bacillus cereus]